MRWRLALAVGCAAVALVLVGLLVYWWRRPLHPDLAARVAANDVVLKAEADRLIQSGPIMTGDPFGQGRPELTNGQQADPDLRQALDDLGVVARYAYPDAAVFELGPAAGSFGSYGFQRLVYAPSGAPTHAGMPENPGDCSSGQAASPKVAFDDHLEGDWYFQYLDECWGDQQSRQLGLVAGTACLFPVVVGAALLVVFAVRNRAAAAQA